VLRGQVEQRTIAPDQIWISMTVGPLGTVLSGYTGEFGWASDQMTGPRLSTAAEQAFLEETTDFYGPLNWERHYPERTVVGAVDIDGVKAWRVDVKDPLGHDGALYFRTSDGLSIGLDNITVTAGGAIPVRTRMSDFRRVADLVVPFKVVAEVDPLRIEMFFDSVEIDVPQLDAAPPAEIAELIAEQKAKR
jgi:hypothetical protein